MWDYCSLPLLFSCTPYRGGVVHSCTRGLDVLFRVLVASDRGEWEKFENKRQMSKILHGEVADPGSRGEISIFVSLKFQS